MSLFLKPAALAAAVANIKNSNCKSRMLEFLILKRATVIQGSDGVPFAESNISYKTAIDELAAVRTYNCQEALKDFTYVNVFDLEDKSKGYKPIKFPSNGPNSTIGSAAWNKVISLDTSVKPRVASLALGYEKHLADFLQQKKGGKPSLTAFALWFFRHDDVESILGTYTIDPKGNSKKLVDSVIEKLALTSDEIKSLFDDSDVFVDDVTDKAGADFFTEETADASGYLEAPVDKETKGGKKNKTLAGAEYTKIVYGAPGTGKSWIVNEAADDFDFHTRVTFYPDYSFFQFVGGYKPKSLYIESRGIEYHEANELARPGVYKRRPVIDYVVVPGPFMSTLLRAYQNPLETHLLIVEELNRANAAAVFGDLFQLLDRDDDGFSTYASTVSIEMSNWLLSQNLVPDGKVIEKTDSGELKLRLPDNFYIWATMNSADQGVQPLDAAFKRRWSFQYVPLNSGESAVEEWPVVLAGRTVLWNKLRRILNKFLIQQGGNGRSLVPEDRLLGPFFMKPSELADREVVLNKLMLYLRDDLVRHNPAVVFASGALNFSDLYDAYTEISDAVVPATDTLKAFTDDLQKLFTPDLASALGTLFIAAAPGTVAAEDE